jgi:flavin reductase (DIM6/NTAB) family NADH-FMN oxidoreductase RutF
MSSDLRQVSPDDFRRACARFATGVCVATVLDMQGAPHGLTVSSFTSVSLEPPQVLICLGHAVTAIDFFRAAKYFGINILSEEQRHLSERFARKGRDRFNGLQWERGQSGVPLLPGALAAMEIEVEQRVSSGDHDIFVGRMIRMSVEEGNPLIHFLGRYRGLSEPRP